MMKTSTAAKLAVILAAIAIPPAIGDDVTLYQPVPSYTGSDQGYSQTGDLSVRPISTAANGQTAYEVHYTPTAQALVNENTTSFITDFEASPTTFTLLADATQYDVAYTASFTEGEVVAEQNCTKQDDETFVCQARGETRINDTTTTFTSVESATLTAPVVPWYTISGSSAAQASTSGAGASTSTGGSNAAAPAVTAGRLCMEVFVAAGFSLAAALLFV